NTSKPLNCFLELPRSPGFCRCVVNKPSHRTRFSQYAEHASNVIDVNQRKRRVWHEWNRDRIQWWTRLEHLRAPRGRGLPDTWPNNPGNAQRDKFEGSLFGQGLPNQFNSPL